LYKSGYFVIFTDLYFLITFTWFYYFTGRNCW